MFNNKTMEQYSQIEYAIYSDIGANISNQVGLNNAYFKIILLK